MNHLLITFDELEPKKLEPKATEGDRELGTGNWGRELGGRELGAANCGEGTWDRELGTGNWGQGTCERIAPLGAPCGVPFSAVYMLNSPTNA